MGGRLGGDWSFTQEELNFLAEGEGDGNLPPINNPRFTQASQVDFLADSSIVLGLKVGSTIRAYPLQVLDWHEVVNDRIDSLVISITYSALCGSSIAFNRLVNGNILELRSSGLLFNSNTIYSENETGTDWLQFQRKGVRGQLIEQDLSSFPVFEMKWAKWKQLFPTSSVLNHRTGFNRPYGTYPYGDYQEDTTRLFFNVNVDIDIIREILFPKEKILGINVNGTVVGFTLHSFSVEDFSIIETEINGEPIVVIGSQKQAFLAAYSRRTNSGTILNFTLNQTDNEVLLVDQEGQVWTIFGENTADSASQLRKLESNIAYWFAWKTFYNNIEIFN